jgi:hypothetical protein
MKQGPALVGEMESAFLETPPKASFVGRFLIFWGQKRRFSAILGRFIVKNGG